MSNMACPFVKLTRESCTNPLLQSEKIIRLLTSIIEVVSPIKGLVRDHFAGTMTLALAAGTMKRRSISIEVGTTCFCTALSGPTLFLIAELAESTPLNSGAFVNVTLSESARLLHDCS